MGVVNKFPSTKILEYFNTREMFHKSHQFWFYKLAVSLLSTFVSHLIFFIRLEPLEWKGGIFSWLAWLVTKLGIFFFQFGLSEELLLLFQIACRRASCYFLTTWILMTWKKYEDELCSGVPPQHSLQGPLHSQDYQSLETAPVCCGKKIPYMFFMTLSMWALICGVTWCCPADCMRAGWRVC